MRLGLVLLCAMLALPARLSAQNVCDDRTAQPATADDASVKLDKLNVAGCLGDTSCPTALCRQFATWSTTPSVAGAVELLTAVRNSAAASGTGENVKRLVARIDGWIAVVGRDAIAESRPALWTYDAGSGGLFLGTPYAIAIDSSIQAGCVAGAAACATVFREAVEIITDATLVRRVNGKLTTPLRDALVTYVTALDQRWTDYFNRAPSQFPWELALNSALYQRHERRGYNEPPSSQWIIAHPTVASEYARGESETFTTAVALEAVGYFTHGVGASLAVAWADRVSGDKVGYGIVLHWQNKFSVGGMAHPGAARRVSILVSPALEKFIATSGAKVREALTRVR